jgi:hypothetical protein
MIGYGALILFVKEFFLTWASLPQSARRHEAYFAVNSSNHPFAIINKKTPRICGAFFNTTVSA